MNTVCMHHHFMSEEGSEKEEGGKQTNKQTRRQTSDATATFLLQYNTVQYSNMGMEKLLVFK